MDKAIDLMMKVNEKGELITSDRFLRGNSTMEESPLLKDPSTPVKRSIILPKARSILKLPAEWSDEKESAIEGDKSQMFKEMQRNVSEKLTDATTAGIVES